MILNLHVEEHYRGEAACEVPRSVGLVIFLIFATKVLRPLDQCMKV